MSEPAPLGHVLVAEDDRGVRESLVRALTFEGYEVEAVPDGAQALESVLARLPDVVVLDVMMPYIDGLTVCRQLRERYRTLPILMLTARHEVSDRVAGLDAGADDYLIKPFALGELLARLRALLRRTSISGADEVLRVGDLSLDAQTRRAERNGRVLDLTKTEFDLLELLMMNAGIVLTRDTIYQRIWGYDFETSSRSLDVYVGYLRTKTEAGGEPRMLHTMRGRRLRAQGTVSLRWRIALGLALIAAIVGTAAAAGAYLSTAQQLENGVDESLVSRTRDANVGPLGPRSRRPIFAGCPQPGELQPAAAAQLVSRDRRDHAVHRGRTDVAGRRGRPGGRTRRSPVPDRRNRRQRLSDADKSLARRRRTPDRTQPRGDRGGPFAAAQSARCAHARRRRRGRALRLVARPPHRAAGREPA